MGGEKNRMLCSRRCICSVYLWHLSATTCICSAYLPPIVVLTSHQSMLNAATKIFIWICTFQKNWSAMCSCCPTSYEKALFILSINHVLHFYKRNDYIYSPVASHHFLHFFKRNNLLCSCPTSSDHKRPDDIWRHKVHHRRTHFEVQNLVQTSTNIWIEEIKAPSWQSGDGDRMKYSHFVTSWFQ